MSSTQQPSVASSKPVVLSAALHLAGLTVDQVINLFEATEVEIDKASGEDVNTLATARGWILDDLERRDSDAFAAWIESADCSVEGLRQLFGASA